MADNIKTPKKRDFLFIVLHHSLIPYCHSCNTDFLARHIDFVHVQCGLRTPMFFSCQIKDTFNFNEKLGLSTLTAWPKCL